MGFGGQVSADEAFEFGADAFDGVLAGGGQVEGEIGHAHRSEVEQVLRDTPRHEFVPDADLELAYNPWQAVITHRFEDGRSASCASAPWLVAAMLDQLHVQPGNRILEIGAGTDTTPPSSLS
ncbi:hypothetical protein [Actinomadura sp. 9N215]|uniref:hypothetical protein n=1 Tax=Actinomadura sp. 9N215 TaxID=3375150 RepID=UPI00379AD06F